MTSGRSEIVDIDVVLHHRTERAVLVSETDDSEKMWLPLSQIEIEHGSGDCWRVSAPEWLLRNKGLI